MSLWDTWQARAAEYEEINTRFSFKYNQLDRYVIVIINLFNRKAKTCLTLLPW